MKNRYSGYGIARLLAASVVVTLLVSLLVSCDHEKMTVHGNNTRYLELDSVMGTIADVDSLEALARQSDEQHDLQGQMLALRHKAERLSIQARFGEAITANSRAFAVAADLKDTIEMAINMNQMGDGHRRLGDMSQANGCYFKVLKLCDKYSNPQDEAMLKVAALTYNGLGNIEMDLGNYATADSVLREALWREMQLGSNLGIAAGYGALGRVKHDLGELDSAWYYMRKSLEFNQLAGSETGVAMCHLHYGELYESEGKFSHAVKEYVLAYNALKEQGNTWYGLEACLALAHVHILLGEEDTARDYLEEAEVESHRIGSKEYQARAHMIHYEFSLLQGDSQEALRQHVRGTELLDSIYGRQKSEEMRSQRNDYQTIRMTGELDLLNQDMNRLKRDRNIQIVLLVLLLLMAAAIIAALIYAMRVRARTQRLMRQVEETRSLFFTNVVHQLRTPLSAIMGGIDGIMADVKNEGNHSIDTGAQQEKCEMIERQGKNLLELVDRILEVGSVRSAITELDWRTGDVVTFMHMLIDSYHDRCVERHIELTYASRETSVDMDIVPHYLTTIMSSLLENAINYSNDYGIITVTSHVDNGMLVIRVADKGMGISKDDLPHVFEPFYRGAVAESLVEGVGIGLTVARDMTMALGGTVAADSMKDQGSVFTVKLPCRHYPNVTQRLEENLKEVFGMTPRHRLPQPESSSPGTSDDGLPVVLVVEDHNDVAHLVGFVLGNRYHVHYASDGEQGLAKAIELMPDLIITDVKMPLMDGVELCRQLRRSPRLCHIPVIILSARNANADRVRGIEAGADAYLVKPFVSEELRTWVVNLLENRKRLREAFSASERPEALSVEDIVPTVANGQDSDAKFLEDFAREIDRYITSGTKIDFDKLALTFKMGESQLRRKIQVLTGKNVPAYIAQLRMEKAMHLLQTSPADTLIGDIAAQCGFHDVAYFSRVFRQHYGKTPTQARNGN